MGEIINKNQLLSLKIGKKGIIALSVTSLLIVAGTTVYGLKISNSQPSSPVTTSTPTPKLEAVTALGRIEPQGEVVKIAPPPNLGGAKVIKLWVEEGDTVKNGQIIATLDNLEREQAAVTLAQQDLKVAQANLDIVKAGAKQGEINAQKASIQRLKAELAGEINTTQVTIIRLQAEVSGETSEQQATIKRLEAELANTEKDFQRYEKLAQDGVISDADLDQRGLALKTARESLEEAKARLRKTQDTLNKQIREENALLDQKKNTLQEQIDEAEANLNRIAEIRPVDVQKAQAEVEKAIAAVKQAEADLELGYVRSPMDGQILKIHTRPGAKVGDDGIAEIGKTQQMMVIAEVYESDINKIHLGQTATVISENGTFKQKLTGKVHQIGLQIGKKDVLDTDPAADVDVRVIEVKILLDAESSRHVAGLTYAKVVAEINLNKAQN